MKKVLLILFFGLFIMNNLFAIQYKGEFLPGYIHGALITYNDSDTLTVKTGYGEANGKFWQITSEAYIELNDTDVLAGGIPYEEDYIYIYIDDSETNYGVLEINSDSGTDVIGSTTEPEWSDDKQGWYNGNDRCIGVVWSPNNSYTILEFTNIDNKYYQKGGSIKTIISAQNPTGNWVFAEATNYSPVNSKALFLYSWNNALNMGYIFLRIAPYENTNMFIIETSAGSASMQQWLQLERGWSRDLYWKGVDSNENNFEIKLNGYEIER